MAVLEQQPLRVARGIATDAVKLFALTRDTDKGDPPVSRWQFPLTAPPWTGTVPGTASVPGTTVARPLAAALRAYQVHGGFTPGPLLLLALLAGGAGLATRDRACAFVTSLAVAVLLGADLYEFSWRYQLPALVTLPLAGALGAHATISSWPLTRTSARSRVTSSTPTPGSGFAGTRSSAATGARERTRSSSEPTSPS